MPALYDFSLSKYKVSAFNFQVENIYLSDVLHREVRHKKRQKSTHASTNITTCQEMQPRVWRLDKCKELVKLPKWIMVLGTKCWENFSKKKLRENRDVIFPGKMQMGRSSNNILSRLF